VSLEADEDIHDRRHKVEEGGAPGGLAPSRAALHVGVGNSRMLRAMRFSSSSSPARRMLVVLGALTIGAVVLRGA